MISELIQKRILIIDGAMGTTLTHYHLTSQDFEQSRFVGCNEYLSISRPDIILDIHHQYLAAGADIIETNTFGATPVVLAEYGLSDRVAEINFKAAQLARKAADSQSTLQKPRFVAGSMGPTTKSLSVTGGITFDELAQNYFIQASGLIDGGVDYLFLETAMDTLNLKAGLQGIRRACQGKGKKVPFAISVTIESSGTMLAGQGIEALYVSLEHSEPLYIGLNCALGPELMKSYVRDLARISRYPILLMPNAGMPDEHGHYTLQPQQFARVMDEYVQNRWVNVIGGCCGTTPDHIRALSQLSSLANPPRLSDGYVSDGFSFECRLSGIEVLEIRSSDGPYLVGERTNVIGSRNFKDLINQNQFEAASEIARKQVQKGAHVIDVCLSNPDRNECEDIVQFLDKVVKKIKVPLMIDSQSPEVVEAAFKKIQGKCILNSVNLEDSGRTCHTLLPLVKQYGAAVVAGCMKGAMPVTAKERLDVATELYDLMVNTYKIDPVNIIFDTLVFPIATGDLKYQYAAKETLLAISQIKARCPSCKIILGISNVSFGLPLLGREVLNSIFFYEAVRAGMDFAIINTEKLLRYDAISEDERDLCRNLLFRHQPSFDKALQDFVSYYREKKDSVVKNDTKLLSSEKRLYQNIVLGSKELLIENLDEELKKRLPLDILNQILMNAMGDVGKKFQKNELIITEVLQSAEVMKTAIDYLAPKMNRVDVKKGVFLLATVYGDVHDIGKNLVNIILSSNGYDVVDLGINQDNKTIIAAIEKYHPHFIGLSGLLVKSAQQMKLIAEDFNQIGITLPLLLGGAALSEEFVKNQIGSVYNGQVFYCKDAMSGLAIVNQLNGG